MVCLVINRVCWEAVQDVDSGRFFYVKMLVYTVDLVEPSVLRLRDCRISVADLGDDRFRKFRSS